MDVKLKDQVWNKKWSVENNFILKVEKNLVMLDVELLKLGQR